MGMKKSLTFILGFICATALFAAVAVFAQNSSLFYVKTQHRIPINLTIGLLNANGQQSNTNVALFVDIESTTTISDTTAILNNLAVAASARANDDTAISLVVGQPQQNFMGVIQLTPALAQNTSTQNRPAPEQGVPQPPATQPPATLPPTNTPAPPPTLPPTNTPVPPPPTNTSVPPTQPPATLPPPTLPPAAQPPTNTPAPPPTQPPTNTPVPPPTQPPTNTPVPPPPTNTQGPPPTNTPVPTRPPTTNRNANVRTGPGVTYEWMLTAPRGSVIEVVGANPERDWYALKDGGWVAAFLIDNVPTNLPIIAPSPTPTTPSTATAPPTATTPPTATSVPPTATSVPPTVANTSVPPPTNTNTPIPILPPTNTSVPPPANTVAPIPDTPVPAEIPTEVPTEMPTNTLVATSLPTRLPLPTRETSRRPGLLRTPIPTATESDISSRQPIVETPDVEEIEEIEEAEVIAEIAEDTLEPTATPMPTATAIVLSSFQYLLDMPRIQVKLIAKDLDFDSLANDLLGQVGQVVYGTGEIVRYETVQDVEDGFYIDARVQADMLVELPDQNNERLWIYYTGQEDLEAGDTIEFWAFVYSRYRYYTEDGVEYLSPYLVELVTE